MKILFLGPDKKPQKILIEFLLNEKNFVERQDNKLDINNIVNSKYDYLISFGYQYIIRKDALDYFKEKTINLHISYLPWNKGADPNLWSILENTPKGVTIHQVEEGLDSGKIVCQQKIFFDSNETFKSSYEILNNTIVELFKENWENIKNNKLKKYPQKGKGSYHKSSEKNKYLDLFINGWDTKIKDLEGKALHA